MREQVRVYLVEKNGNQDVLNRSNHIPGTVDKVYITWGGGKESKKVSAEDFLANYRHAEGCVWVLKEH